jgi:hypothetical protein
MTKNSTSGNISARDRRNMKDILPKIEEKMSSRKKKHNIRSICHRKKTGGYPKKRVSLEPPTKQRTNK